MANEVFCVADSAETTVCPASLPFGEDLTSAHTASKMGVLDRREGLRHVKSRPGFPERLCDF
jgi:hypothetical protein